MASFDPMFTWYRRRWLDLVASIYIYNEHRGYTAIDEVLAGLRGHADPDFIAEIEQHRADEYKHYLMFKRWFQKRGQMPLFVDRTCGHIDRFIEIMFGRRIDDLDTPDRRMQCCGLCGVADAVTDHQDRFGIVDCKQRDMRHRAHVPLRQQLS